MVSCCMKCERRHIGCHATCPDYIAESQRNAMLRDEAYKNRRADMDATSWQINSAERTKRRKR